MILYRTHFQEITSHSIRLSHWLAAVLTESLSPDRPGFGACSSMDEFQASYDDFQTDIE